MQVSLNWLSELLPGLPRDPEVLIEALTSIGLEVEGVRAFGSGLDPVRFAAVVSVQRHPKRDQLQLVSLDLGSGKTQTVVCGAKNVPGTGGLVVLAPLGTHLPAVGFTLSPKDIGGVTSEGMLCSETELGLASDADGILTFEAGAFEPGRRFLDAFPFATDTIFQLGITPNRPDALGHIGVARDLAARFGLAFAPPKVELPSGGAARLRDVIQIENRAPEACRRYGARVVSNVTVRTSPAWLRWRLSSLGVRPISNIVDITNLLLLEYGNPMHAFDLERVSGRHIIIRQASEGERMTTLDDKQHQLEKDDLVIADAELPSALAGIMGGRDSEIRSDTRNVLLECAYFEPTVIRRTARRLGLHTDSSYRFERGVDYAVLATVLARACALLRDLADGQPIDGQVFADGAVPERPLVRLRGERLNALLGAEVDFDEALSVLARLGFDTVERIGNEATLRGASHRPDVSLEVDLIEEVARLRGLHEIPTRLPAIAPQDPSIASQFERKCRRVAAGLGLSEAVTYSFVSSRSLELLSAGTPAVRLKNPLTEERDVMTTSLLVGLVEAVQRARRHGETQIRLFTVASIFLPPSNAPPTPKETGARPRRDDDDAALPHERLCFAAVLSGERPRYLSKPEAFDVYDAKGVAVEFIERVTGYEVQVRPSSEVLHLHPRAAGTVCVGDEVVGHFGQMHPDISDAFELDATLQLVELDLERLEAIGTRRRRFQPIPKLPAITRDVAFDAPASLLVGDVEAAIAAGAGELCESVELFDVFQPDGVESERRSLGFRLVYRDPKSAADPSNARTLTDKEVDARQQRVVEAVTKLGGVQRA